MYGAKWHDFKLVLVMQTYLTEPALRLATPHIINLIADPQEREPFNLPHLHTLDRHALQSNDRGVPGEPSS